MKIISIGLFLLLYITSLAQNEQDKFPAISEEITIVLENDSIAAFAMLA